MFVFEWESKTINDRSEDLEKLSNPVMSFRLVDKVEEDIVNRPSNEGAKIKEFAIDTVQGRLEKIALTRILRVKELEEIQDKWLVDVSLGQICVKVRAFNEAQKEFVYNLKMRPRELEDGFIFFRIESVACGVDRWGYRAEKVGGKLDKVLDLYHKIRKHKPMLTMLTTSGYTFSVMTPRWVVIYSNIS